ncbi:MAG TPA: hypothetical protein VKA46_12945 [Gemmataceae bacterium]|nr:hypothetical protein [Gemmataceae bacterium]
MSRLVIPISYRTLWGTGDVMLWIEITLSLRSGTGNYVDYDFNVDSGTEITTFPAYEAKQLGLVVPVRPAQVQHTQSVLEVRSGMLRFRIDGMDQTEYAVACLFLGDPNVRPSPNAPPGALARNLLQPLALLEKLRFAMEKDPAALFPYGQLVVEKT